MKRFILSLSISLIAMSFCCQLSISAAKSDAKPGKSAGDKLQPSTKYPGVDVWVLKEEYKYDVYYNPYSEGIRISSEGERINYRSLYYDYEEPYKVDQSLVCVWGLKDEYKNNAKEYQHELCAAEGDAGYKSTNKK